MQHLNGVVWSTPLDLPGRCDTCMHQHSTSDEEEEEEVEEGGTPHINTQHNVKVWVDFFGGFHK